MEKNFSGNPMGVDVAYGFQMNAQRFHAITSTPSGRGLAGDTGKWFNNAITKNVEFERALVNKIQIWKEYTIAPSHFCREEQCDATLWTFTGSGMGRLCSMVYILRHKRAPTDTRQPSLRGFTDANAEGPMGPGRSIPLTAGCQGQI